MNNVFPKLAVYNSVDPSLAPSLLMVRVLFFCSLTSDFVPCFFLLELRSLSVSFRCNNLVNNFFQCLIYTFEIDVQSTTVLSVLAGLNFLGIGSLMTLPIPW